MSNAARLTEALERRRIAVPASRKRYDTLVARLRALGIGAGAPKAGTPFPDFALPDANGVYRALSSLLAGGPIVLSFIRGGWCPYCRLELDAWQSALPDLAAAGASLVVVTAEVAGRAQAVATCFDGPMTVLCDVDHGVALDLGLAFFVGEEVLGAYRDAGIDIEAIYGYSAGLLPVPATFLIAPDRTILFAYTNPEFRERAEPDDIIALLAG
jgi:peroxiredoxin